MRDDGDGRRFCSDCTRHVHDLSQLSRGEAERLINMAATGSAAERGVCVWFKRAPDGTILTRDDATLARAERRSVLRRVAAGIVTMVGLGTLLSESGCDQTGPEVGEPRLLRTMGIVSLPPTTRPRGHEALGEGVVMGSAAPPPPATEPSTLPASPATRPVLMGKIRAR